MPHLFMSQKTNDFETPHQWASCSIRPDNEILACGLHHFFGDNLDLVCDQHMLHLHHETIDQTQVSPSSLSERNRHSRSGMVDW